MKIFFLDSEKSEKLVGTQTQVSSLGHLQPCFMLSSPIQIETLMHVHSSKTEKICQQRMFVSVIGGTIIFSLPVTCAFAVRCSQLQPWWDTQAQAFKKLVQKFFWIRERKSLWVANSSVYSWILQLWFMRFRVQAILKLCHAFWQANSNK